MDSEYNISGRLHGGEIGKYRISKEDHLVAVYDSIDRRRRDLGIMRRAKPLTAEEQFGSKFYEGPLVCSRGYRFRPRLTRAEAALSIFLKPFT
jgi:hypothetical protein